MKTFLIWHDFYWDDASWGCKKWRQKDSVNKWCETNRNDVKQKEMTRNKKKWREAIAHDVSPVAMFYFYFWIALCWQGLGRVLQRGNPCRTKVAKTSSGKGPRKCFQNMPLKYFQAYKADGQRRGASASLALGNNCNAHLHCTPGGL